MILQESILRLKQKQLELQEEQNAVKQKLSKILFEKDFSYEMIEIPEQGYFIYPYIVPCSSFQISSEKITLEEDTIVKTYLLLSTKENLPIEVKENALLIPKKANFTIENICGEAITHIISVIRYTITIDGFHFCFYKNIPEEQILKHNEEIFTLNFFSDAMDAITVKNTQISNNFSTSLRPYCYYKQQYSFEDIVMKSTHDIVKIRLADNLVCTLTIERKMCTKPFSIALKCNRTTLNFTGKFEVIKYSARVLLVTMVNNKKVIEFSDDGYCVPYFTGNDAEEFEVKSLFC